MSFIMKELLLMALIFAIGQQRRIKHRTINDWKDPLERYSNSELVDRFRLDRQGILELCRDIEPYLTVSTFKNRSITTTLQLLITLTYLASGDMQRTIGDSLSVAQSSV